MTGDIRWITSATRYEAAVRLHQEFIAFTLYEVATALDACGGDVAKARRQLKEVAK